MSSRVMTAQELIEQGTSPYNVISIAKWHERVAQSKQDAGYNATFNIAIAARLRRTAKEMIDARV